MHSIQETLAAMRAAGRALWPGSTAWRSLVRAAAGLLSVGILLCAGVARSEGTPASFEEGVLYDVVLEVSGSQSLILQELYVTGEAVFDDRKFLVVHSPFLHVSGSKEKHSNGYVEISKVRAIFPTGQKTIRVACWRRSLPKNCRSWKRASA